MGCDPKGMDPVNQFALVIYIPDPLGRFLDDLRRELVPGCSPHAHVSVLPPRPLSGEHEAACSQARALAEEFAPFEITAGEIEIFPITNVIYIGVECGAEELRRMHRAMATGSFQFIEPFPYHPHITVAQEFPPELVSPLYERARQRWKEYSGPRTFRAEQMHFVQNTAQKRWMDLQQIWLGAVPVL